MKIDKLNKEITKIINIDIFKIKKTDLKSLRDWDSLKYIDLVSCLENELKIKLTSQDVKKITNTDYLKKIILKNVKK